MKIPYVIDNVQHRLADVINAILHSQPGRQVDIATACFSIRGYQQVRHTLPSAAELRLLAGDEEGADGAGDDLPASLAGEIDASEEARQLIALLPRLDAGKCDRRRLHRALQEDIDALTDIWYKIKAIGLAEDAKLQRLRDLLAGELRGQKMLIFTCYKDMARYLQRGLAGGEAQGWLAQAGSPRIRRIDGRVKPEDRVRLVQQFAPVANGRPEDAGSEQEIDILIATDVLSEGQNLQDCGVLANYDLHRNPTRPVAEEQNVASQILCQHLNTPGLDRAELKRLRAFLKQPLVGAAVARLRQAVQQYSASGGVAGLVETVRGLAQQQAPPPAPAPSSGKLRPLSRDDLHLVCYEYLA